MDDASSSVDGLEARFAAWAQARSDIRAALVVGSRAREHRPADRWADLDIIIVAKHPERYVSTTDWLGEVGHVWLTTVGQTVAGGPERFVLFEGGAAVDFVVISDASVKQLARVLPVLTRFPGVRRLIPGGALRQLALAADLFGRGFRVLTDKDELAAKLPLLRSQTSPAGPPTAAEFHEIISRFWFFADRIVRKLRRGELYVAAKFHHDVMYTAVLPMIEWHAKATRGWEYDTWNGGHFLEEWADPRAVEALRHAFPQQNVEEITQALAATTEMFRWLAVESSERLGYRYPTAMDEEVSNWIRTNLSEAR